MKQIAASIRERVSLSTVRHWCDLMGLPRRGRGRLTPEVENKLRGIVAERPLARPEEIREALGNIVSIYTLKDWCRQLQIRLPRSDSILTEELVVRLRALAENHPCPSLEQLRQVIGGNPSLKTIKKFCHQLGIPHKRTPRRRQNFMANLKTMIRASYPEGKPPTLRELVVATGNLVSRQVMRKLCRKLGLAYRRETRKPCRGPTPAQEARLRQLLALQPVPTREEIGRELGVTRNTVSRWIARVLGVPRTKHGPTLNADIESRFRSLCASAPLISRGELARAFGVHPITIWSWKRRLGIAAPPPPENGGTPPA